MGTTTNIVVMLKTFDDDKIRKMLETAGHTGWRRIEVRSREENEKRIWELLQKAGGVESFRQAGSDSKPNCAF
jgi:hypothetical protein